MALGNPVGIVRPIVDSYVETLRAHRIRPSSVYLFGSYANGTPRDESDIDVAVVSEDLSGDRIEDQVLLMEYRWDVDLRIEPHPFRPEDFTPENPWAAQIMATGIRIV